MVDERTEYAGGAGWLAYSRREFDSLPSGHLVYIMTALQVATLALPLIPRTREFRQQ